MIKKSIAKKGLLLTSGISVLALLLVSCGVSKTWESSVQLVVSNDIENSTEKAIFQDSYQGVKTFFEQQKKIKDFPKVTDSKVQDGNGIWKKSSKTTSDLIATYKDIKSSGSDIIVAANENQKDALQAISSNDPKYAADKKDLANTGFVFVDGSIEKNYNNYTSNPNNITSVTFSTDDGSFLVGVATAIYLNYNQTYFLNRKGTSTSFSSENKFELLISGFIEEPTPKNLSFLNGFRLGLAYFNEVIFTHIDGAFDETAKEGLKNTDREYQPGQYIKKVKWISSGNDDAKPAIENHVSKSVTENEQIVKRLLDKGVNVIFTVSNSQVEQTVKQVISRGAHTAVIGTDIAQEVLNLNQDAIDREGEMGIYKSNKKVIPFSSIKSRDVAVQNILTAIQTNKDSNEYKGFGYNNIATVKSGSVGVSEAGYEFLIDPLFWKEKTGNSDSSLIQNQKKALDDVQTLKKEVEGGKTKTILDKYFKLLTATKSTSAQLQVHNQIDEVKEKDSKTSKSTFSTSDEDGAWAIKGDELLTKYSEELPKFVGADKDLKYSEFPTTAQKVIDSTTTTLDTTKFKWTFKKL